MTKNEMLDELLRELLAEGWADSHIAIPEDAASKRHLLRTLMNIRPPLPPHPELLVFQHLGSHRGALGQDDLVCERLMIGPSLR